MFTVQFIFRVIQFKVAWLRSYRALGLQYTIFITLITLVLAVHSELQALTIFIYGQFETENTILTWFEFYFFKQDAYMSIE